MGVAVSVIVGAFVLVNVVIGVFVNVLVASKVFVGVLVGVRVAVLVGIAVTPDGSSEPEIPVGGETFVAVVPPLIKIVLLAPVVHPGCVSALISVRLDEPVGSPSEFKASAGARAALFEAPPRRDSLIAHP